jgi:hypothetical protein
VDDILVFNNRVWTCGTDVTVWDIDFAKQTANKVKTIQAHTGRVFCMEAIGHYVLSGSFDMSIILYDATVITISFNNTQKKPEKFNSL